jgi:hypothetical protein
MGGGAKTLKGICLPATGETLILRVAAGLLATKFHSRMASTVNLQEHIGNAVGTRHLREEPPMLVYQRLLDHSRRIRKPLPYPKGVFRFKSHEEADAWKWDLILKAAVKNSPRVVSS